MRVGGDDDNVGGCDVLVGQLVLGTDGTLGFHGDTVAGRGRGLLEGVCRHERVGDAGRAGGDGDDPFADRGGLRRRSRGGLRRRSRGGLWRRSRGGRRLRLGR